MIKKSSIIFMAVSLLFLFSCKDEDLGPIIQFETLGKGAYPRGLGVTNDVYDLRNLGSSAWTYSVEFVDIEKGKLVSEYSVYVSFSDKNASNGDQTKAEKLFKTYGTGDFGSSPTGFVSINVSIPANDVISSLGLNAADIKAKDEFKFRTELKQQSGSVHSSGNSTSSVNSSAFKAYFDASILNTCPLGDAEFTGNYAITYDAAPTGTLGPIFGADPGVVALAAVAERGSTKRSFKIKYLPGTAKEKEVTVVLDFLCDRIEVPDIKASNGCISGEVFVIGQGAITNFDINDKSSFKVNLVEFKKDAGCGYAQAPVSLTFTKQ
jgi:hypothetical protein